jgi:hypothetical protein
MTISAQRAEVGGVIRTPEAPRDDMVDVKRDA